jgi:2-dehydropantoate 2-reductase
MKIAIVGCGALGSFYGAKFCRAGYETHFLLRSDYDVVRREGVRISSVDGDFEVHPHCANTAGAIGPSDLVVVSMKTTGNAALAGILPSLLGPSTTVITLQNGLGTEEPVAALVGEERVMGGLCYLGSTRLAPGKIRHFSGGLVVMGEYRRPAGERTHRVADLFRQAGVIVRVVENLEQAHWEKLVWNIPFNGLGLAACAGIEAMENPNHPIRRVGPCLSTDRLLADPRWERLVRQLMLEIILAANARGFSLSDSLVEKQFAITRGIGAYKASTVLDFERGLPLELDGLFFKPLELAGAAGVKTPILSRLCAVLGVISK